jgi:hypothetical protein
MTAGQRRTLWLCILALTFVFWYEARGEALVWRANAPAQPLYGEAARAWFWQHCAYGVFFLVFGGLLTVVLRRKDPPAPYHWADWLALAAGLGLLAGTLYRSYAMIHP